MPPSQLQKEPSLDLKLSAPDQGNILLFTPHNFVTAALENECTTPTIAVFSLFKARELWSIKRLKTFPDPTGSGGRAAMQHRPVLFPVLYSVLLP